MKKLLPVFLSLIAFSPCFAGENSSFFFTPEMVSPYIQEYSAQEKESILKDLEVVKGVCFSSSNATPYNKPLYLATAGSPASDHALIMERFIADNLPQLPIVYLDPDERGLKFMVHTYYSQSLSALAISECKTYFDAVKNAYTKWRSASNFITYTLLENAFNTRQNIAHGTTSTKKYLPSFYAKVKKSGYEITLLLCSAPETVLNEIIEHRNNEKKMYFSTPEDDVSKGENFAKMLPTYLTYADTLYIFWKSDFKKDAQLAAVLKKGKIDIVDSKALDLFTEQFEKNRKKLNKDDENIPSWKELLASYKKRF